MSALFGIFQRDGSLAAATALATLQNACAPWGHEGGGLWREGVCGLGQARSLNTPESIHESLPLHDSTRRLAFTATARLDNREEIIAECGMQNDELGNSAFRIHHSALPDSHLLYLAYLRWGEDCVQYLYGDWSFAVWNPAERRLFLARDHFGNTALYYYLDARVFAFASERRALLNLNLAPLSMDELYLAQVLVSWPAYHDGRTIYPQIKRLPPAHSLTVTPEKSETRLYWRMEDTPIVRLPNRQDYVEAFREKFDAAVEARLRVFPEPALTPGPSPEGRGEKISPSPTGGGGRGVRAVASTLSGGLDSNSVSVTAARLLRPSGQRLRSYTSVPLYDTTPYVGSNFGDELPYAQASAQLAGNIDLQTIPAVDVTPLQAIRRALQIHDEPAHAAGNFFWIYALESAAAAQGCRVILNGQNGNAGISWTGDLFSQPLDFQIRRLGWQKWLRQRIKGLAPSGLIRAWERSRAPADWFRSSAIHPQLASRLDLLNLRLETDPPPQTALDQRFAILKPGRTFIGATHAQMGAAHGLEIRDPTADARLVAFTLSVPDDVFIDPQTGLDRWLIREAMKDRLPDEVRLNRRRGRQAGDLVPRLRASAPEVEQALAEIEGGPAREYLDTAHMRATWQLIQTDDTREAFNKAITILTRGIMAGLWVNEFYSR